MQRGITPHAEMHMSLVVLFLFSGKRLDVLRSLYSRKLHLIVWELETAQEHRIVKSTFSLNVIQVNIQNSGESKVVEKKSFAHINYVTKLIVFFITYWDEKSVIRFRNSQGSFIVVIKFHGNSFAGLSPTSSITMTV